jgi:hypothetical protein
MWNLWWTKWRWNGVSFFLGHFGFPLPFITKAVFHAHLSSGVHLRPNTLGLSLAPPLEKKNDEKLFLILPKCGKCGKKALL